MDYNQNNEQHDAGLCDPNRGLGFVLLRIAGDTVDMAEVLGIPDRESFVRRFAGSALMRPRRAGLVRNALAVAANTGRKDLLPGIRSLRESEETTVAEMAAWACRVLELGGAGPASTE